MKRKPPVIKSDRPSRTIDALGMGWSILTAGRPRPRVGQGWCRVIWRANGIGRRQRQRVRTPENARKNLQRSRNYVLVLFMHTQPTPTEAWSGEPPSGHPKHAPDQPAEDAQYYRRILHDLIDMGADLAHLVHQQAKAQAQTPEPTRDPAAEPAPDLALAFDRIARTIRRTIALARKLAEPLPAPPATKPTQDRNLARRRIIRDVEDTIQRKANGTHAESLHDELFVRLDAPDLEDDIDHRPITDIIEDICRDLGLAAMPGTHPWKRRTPEDIKTLCGRAAASSPVAPRAAPLRTPTGSDPPLRRRDPDKRAPPTR